MAKKTGEKKKKGGGGLPNQKSKTDAGTGNYLCLKCTWQKCDKTKHFQILPSRCWKASIGSSRASKGEEEAEEGAEVGQEEGGGGGEVQRQ